MNVEVFAIGCPVKIGKKIEGHITSINITANRRITYQVDWWDGNNHKSEWLDAFMVERLDQDSCIRTKIGFVE